MSVVALILIAEMAGFFSALDAQRERKGEKMGLKLTAKHIRRSGKTRLAVHSATL